MMQKERAKRIPVSSGLVVESPNHPRDARVIEELGSMGFGNQLPYAPTVTHQFQLNPPFEVAGDLSFYGWTKETIDLFAAKPLIQPGEAVNHLAVLAER